MAGLPPWMPFGMSAPPGLSGKTAYHYFTKDGGPPNKGAPPSGSSSSQGQTMPPPYQFMPPSCGPPSSQPGPIFIPPSSGFPGAVCCPNGGPPQPPQPPSWFPPPPPPTPGGSGGFNFGGAVAHAAAQKPEPPVSGNRVKDRLLVVKDSGGTGYVVPKHNATFHLFTHNILEKYTVNHNNQLYIPPNACEPFRVMTAACSMPIEELIEQLDCIKDAPPGYPRYAIGIAEAFDCGNGWFQIGTKIHLDETMASMTIKELWGESIGEAGESRPRYLVRLPGKQASS
ncbi:hypothetical protein LTR10_017139 [Elasticomyces elasticus]|uniref:Uncharacterized protein n=1 Tax=Exophiala sideris TaxID=1016849 RepID=A0ABR0JFV7_9EURO|nr:hypothetical protein LTR10_017139 [Elasticomyces elasticus]KAK5032564.1 hypothetical protein LTS07_003973 [Exophiala sideris]KAK5037256.1 hypothetical protein LTR13_005062 [Exophiala sideris]KAK5062089.1 hypothetical protein LTR69_004446 [Exophiala sideris]KAK5182414.1 hypothetical protein LTR44_005426 [Eurotiomycetes sp. CCFEE 6388]